MTTTDRSSASLPLSGQAAPSGPPVVWDPLVRISHWGIAAVVLGNAVLSEGGSAVHIAIGWTGLALLLVRLCWGVVGPAEARFSAFPPNPASALRHLAGLMRGKVRHYPSHNPAGALMAYALWASLAVVTLTGLAMTTNSPMKQAELEAAVAAGDWSVVAQSGEDVDDGEGEDDDGALGKAVEEVHEVAANLMLFLAFVHVIGVFVEGRAMRRNLVSPMVFGSRGPKS